MSTTDMGNADHPYRKSAIRIIEQVIEPLLGEGIAGEGLAGEKYYGAEDAIVNIIHDSVSSERLSLYDKWKNQLVRVEIGGLEVDCYVKDVKYVNGYPEFQVTPVTGDKHVWVQKFKTKK